MTGFFAVAAFISILGRMFLEASITRTALDAKER
jgi:hypothetical protein